MQSMVAERTLHRFNLAEYEAMIRHGILGAGDRVELIAGEIVEMPPIGDPHKGSVTFLQRFFERHLADGQAIVMVQQALAIVPNSMPQPDLLLLRYRSDFYRHRANYPDDALLAVEVADASLRYDRTTKLSLYANAGVREYWIVDVNGKAIEVYREAAEDAYASVRVARGKETVAPNAFPDCSTSVNDVLGLESS